MFTGSRPNTTSFVDTDNLIRTALIHTRAHVIRYSRIVIFCVSLSEFTDTRYRGTGENNDDAVVRARPCIDDRDSSRMETPRGRFRRGWGGIAATARGIFLTFRRLDTVSFRPPTDSSSRSFRFSSPLPPHHTQPLSFQAYNFRFTPPTDFDLQLRVEARQQSANYARVVRNEIIMGWAKFVGEKGSYVSRTPSSPHFGPCNANVVGFLNVF